MNALQARVEALRSELTRQQTLAERAAFLSAVARQKRRDYLQPAPDLFDFIQSDNRPQTV